MKKLKEQRPRFQKSMFIILDALRYDAILNDLDEQKLYPEITKLAKAGILQKVSANAQSTQYVLPSLFSLTYPLDEGGYNYGIRNRESSYAKEIKKKYSRKNYMISTCNGMGVGNSYEDGFDENLTCFDFRILIEQKINRTLIYEIELYEQGKVSKNEMLKKIKKEFGLTLNLFSNYYKKYNVELWPKKLKKINQFILANSKKENELLHEKPEYIVRKIKDVRGGAYWYTLGKSNYKDLGYYIERLRHAILWRLMMLGKKYFIPFLLIGHYQVRLSEIIHKVCKKISTIKNENWHIHMHLLDIHDCRSVNHFFYFLSRFKYFPKWFVAKIKSETKHRFLYSSALMYVNDNLKILFNHMKKENIFNDTLILITGDHGAQYAETPRKMVYIGERTFYEHLDVPLIISHKINRKIQRNLCDSMGTTATFLDLLDVPLHSSFKGESIFIKGKKYSIAENAGSGNADVLRRDLYFTIITKDYKLMTVLKEKKFFILKLFNVIDDPKEIKNLYSPESKKKYREVILSLIKIIFNERKQVFNLRNIENLKDLVVKL